MALQWSAAGHPGGLADSGISQRGMAGRWMQEGPKKLTQPPHMFETSQASRSTAELLRT